MNALSVWDRTPRGLLELRGADRAPFLQGMVSNDVLGLAPGQSRHAALLDTTGHVLADLHVHAFPEALVVETDPDCLPVLRQTLSKFLIMEDVTLADVSDRWAVVSVFGADAGTLAGLPGDARPLSVPLAPGADLWLPASEKAVALMALTRRAAVTPLADEDAEAMRVEAGLPAWGRELSPSVLLPEAGMADAVSYTKGCYVGQEIIARLHARGQTNRGLRHILLADDAPLPPVGATVHVPEDGPEPGREIGRLTSVAAPRGLGGRALALAFVRKEYFADGTPVSVQIAQPGGPVFSYDAVVRDLPSQSATQDSPRPGAN